jgi:glycosyltransferase involved in cell wall biosynthesis
VGYHPQDCRDWNQVRQVGSEREIVYSPCRHPHGTGEEMICWPRITIVTPSLNQGKYLEETILSVLSQNYPNLEYIIVDGGSTGDSPEIIRRYHGHLAWWISEPDGGQSEAINKGLARATGQVFNWIGADDLLASHALHRIGEAFAVQPDAELVAGDHTRCDDQGRAVRVSCPSSF